VTVGRRHWCEKHRSSNSSVTVIEGTGKLEIGRKPISNPKPEILNWTPQNADVAAVQFKISDNLGFRI